MVQKLKISEERLERNSLRAEIAILEELAGLELLDEKKFFNYLNRVIENFSDDFSCISALSIESFLMIRVLQEIDNMFDEFERQEKDYYNL